VTLAIATDTPVPRLRLPDAELARAGHMLDRGRWAASTYAKFGASDVKRVVDAVAAAAFDRAAHYAEWAVRETGFGVIADKRLKNESCSKGLLEYYAGQTFTDLRIDPARKLVELPRPAGLIFALAPSTNPIATLYFKTILALMTRNAIVLSPHPAAKACTADAARYLTAAAEAAGAPDGILQVIEEPSIPLLEQLLVDSRVDLIVATGGPAVVRAAYRSGHPAIGVGPGNAPVLVDATADLRRTAQRLVVSKSFDNSILCTNESVVLALKPIADRLLDALGVAGAHLCSPDEVEKLRHFLFPAGQFNVKAIGKNADWIAREAGFSASGTKILVAPIDRVQPEEPLAREKLCPVLGFARFENIESAISGARSMMRRSGRGHSAAVHSRDPETILAFSAAVPALRIVVNAGCSEGASGLHTHLGPSMTIGTGFAGGSSVGENLGPHHLVNWARIAYNKDSKEEFGDFSALRLNTHADRTAVPPDRRPRDEQPEDAELRRRLKAIVLEELREALKS